VQKTRRLRISATLSQQLLVALIVVVRLSVFLLHTHAQADLDGPNSVPQLTQDTHCLACDLESTAAVEADPVIVLPSEVFVRIDRAVFVESSDCQSQREAASSRGPPAQTI
jgi:hypothetical protein